MSKRVLHIINSPGLGGAETMVKDIVTYFPDHKIFCLRFDKKDRFAELINRTYYGVQHNGNYKFNPKILFKLILTIYREKPEALHVHLANSLTYGLVAKVFFPQIKLIYHEHGEIIYGNKILELIVRAMGKYFPVSIAVSDYLRKSLLMHNKLAIVFVCKNYTDVGFFSEAVLNKRGFYNIGFIGRLTHLKGCDVLLRAIPYTKNKITISIYGDGVEEASLDKLTRELGITEQVTFKGYESDRMKIYSELDIVVVPSRMEAVGLVNLEARAAGCIVVSSRVGGIPEYIEHGKTGLLFEKENYIELAKILDSLIDNPQLSVNIAQKSLADIKQYDILPYMKHLGEIYNNILA